MTITDIITLVGAIATFLFGMSTMTDGLEKLSSGRLEGILERLYDYYLKRPEKLPEDFHGIIEAEGVERAACDYISGMTDSYAMEKYGELFIPFAWTVK